MLNNNALQCIDGPASAALDEAAADDPVPAESRTLWTGPPDAYRRAKAEEVARTVAFLDSDAPGFMSGAIFDVNAASYLSFRGRPGKANSTRIESVSSAVRKRTPHFDRIPYSRALLPHENLEMQPTNRDKRTRTAHLPITSDASGVAGACRRLQYPYS